MQFILNIIGDDLRYVLWNINKSYKDQRIWLVTNMKKFKTGLGYLQMYTKLWISHEAQFNPPCKNEKNMVHLQTYQKKNKQKKKLSAYTARRKQITEATTNHQSD